MKKRFHFLLNSPYLRSVLCQQFRHTWHDTLRPVVCYTKTSSPIFNTGSETLYNFRLLPAPIPGNRGKFQQGVQRFTFIISMLKLYYVGQAISVAQNDSASLRRLEKWDSGLWTPIRVQLATLLVYRLEKVNSLRRSDVPLKETQSCLFDSLKASTTEWKSVQIRLQNVTQYKICGHPWTLNVQRDGS